MPVYLGTPDITPFLPHPDAALVYQDAQQISDEMLRLMNDTADYEQRVRPIVVGMAAEMDACAEEGTPRSGCSRSAWRRRCYTG